MINTVTEEYAKVRLTSGNKISKGQFELMLDDAKRKHKVSGKVDVRLAQKYVQRRYKKKLLKCNHRGTESPMSRLEPAILEIALQRGKMNQPLTVEEGLYPSNSLIKPNSQISWCYLLLEEEGAVLHYWIIHQDSGYATWNWPLGRVSLTLQSSTGIEERDPIWPQSERVV